ncbi:RagB/SusD family nutrient uptake outer membrane protein [Rapidithrix thailandica]|uniref:RagB/SusD family nutrient uptake outer membrane protein n=1 Tax=Rapidithrix thailandica TaxID=413964 RepID=A0AAW9S128_9BACT
MKHRFILYIFSAFFLGMAACTDNFDEYNTNPKGLTDDVFIGEFFPQVQQSIYYNFNNSNWEFQLHQNLNGDVFSGYMMSPSVFAGNNNNMTYNLVDGWNTFPYDLAYGKVMAPVRLIQKRTQEENLLDFHGVALILKVAAMHQVTDLYGPIPYTEYGEHETSTPFDNQQDVYYAFFDELKTAVDDLTAFVDENGDVKPFTRYDLVFGGDYMKWIKYGNTLRLRLAIRIANADPDKAKQEAEAAVNHKYGVMDSEDDLAAVSASNIIHPLNVINDSWNDIRMGAPIESIMKGYEDPRLPVYFEPSVEVPGEYKGIRQGIEITAKEVYVGFSKISTTLIKRNSPLQLMAPEEAYFLRAEGALRGWNMGGSAKDLYEMGIKISFSRHGVLDAYADYIEDDESTAAPYIDPQNPENNVEAGSEYLSNVTIKWEDGDDFETKLERIITQKWLAVFPDGKEAWAEFRRTGYPSLFPVVINNSQGKIPAFIKRLRFPQSEYQANGEQVQQAIQMIGGEDNGGVSLWWDVD